MSNHEKKRTPPATEGKTSALYFYEMASLAFRALGNRLERYYAEDERSARNGVARDRYKGDPSNIRRSKAHFKRPNRSRKLVASLIPSQVKSEITEEALNLTEEILGTAVAEKSNRLRQPQVVNRRVRAFSKRFPEASKKGLLPGDLLESGWKTYVLQWDGTLREYVLPFDEFLAARTENSWSFGTAVSGSREDPTFLLGDNRSDRSSRKIWIKNCGKLSNALFEQKMLPMALGIAILTCAYAYRRLA